MTHDLKLNMNFNHIFMMIMLFVGFILFYTSWNIDSQLQDKKLCTSRVLKTNNKIVLCLGLTLIVSSLSFFTCSSFNEKAFSEFSIEIYVGSMALFGLFLIYFGAKISGNATGDCFATGGSIIWMMGLFIIAACGYFFNHKYNFIKLKA